MPSEGKASGKKIGTHEGSATSANGRCFHNEVKHWANYETKSINLHRKLSAGADGGRANAIQSPNGPAEDDNVFRIPGPERCPACHVAAHILACTLSPAVAFKRAVPKPNTWGNAGATTNEQFTREPARDDKQCGLAASALRSH